MKSIYYEIYRHLEQSQDKIDRKCFNRFQYDDFDIILSGDIYWLEYQTYHKYMPEYLLNRLVYILGKKGYKPLFSRIPLKNLA
jgi:beta-lactamase superfamily II metal-dependent hydrolase